MVRVARIAGLVAGGGRGRLGQAGQPALSAGAGPVAVTEVAVAAPAFAFAARLRARLWIVGWWAAGRGIVLATAALLHFAGPVGRTRADEHTHLFGVLGAWDAHWYRIVAERGYSLVPGRASDPAFFPLFPLLLRTGHAFGLGYYTAGVFISNIAFLVALVAFEALTRELFGARFAHRATMYLAIFPLGFVFSMGYPESVALCAIALTALAALRRRWLLAAAVAALGTLTRPETLFVSLALLPLALREQRPRERRLALGSVFAPFASLACFALYLGVRLDDPLAWAHAERAWGRRFTPLGLLTAIERVPTMYAGNAWVVRDITFFVLYVGLLAAALRAGTPRSWVAAGAFVVVLPTFSGSFTSIGRFGLLAPALLWGLASLGRSRRTDLLIRVLSIALLAVGTAAIPFAFS